MTRRLVLWSLALLVVACAFAVLLAVAPAASAQPKSWNIDSLNVLLDVQENGDVVVDETYSYTFVGNYHFVIRNIPLESLGGIADIEVRDASGIVLPESGVETPGTFYTYEDAGQQYIQVNFDLTDTSTTYTFHYVARSAISFGEEDDALWWDVFDAQTPVSIGNAKVTVQLPGSVPSEDLQHDFMMGYGVEPNVFSPGPSTLVFEPSNMPAYTSFRIAAGFPN